MKVACVVVILGVVFYALVLCREHADHQCKMAKEVGEQQMNWNEKKVTKRENKLLNRKKRYLTFPMGTAFILTLSIIKSLMIRAPSGLRLAGECDVPFTLPSDTRWVKRQKGVYRRQKREVYDQISTAFQGLGFNGTACINRAICDARVYAPLKGTSLVKDLLMALFKVDNKNEYLNICNEETYAHCELPFLKFIEGMERS